MSLAATVTVLASCLVLGATAEASSHGDRHVTGDRRVGAGNAATVAEGAHKPLKGREVGLVPASPVQVSNCIPFANNVTYGFSGFVYRNVPAFHLLPGDTISFDLGSRNGQAVRRDIYFSRTNKNPAAAVTDGTDITDSQGVRAEEWQQVVSEAQTPTHPRGDGVVGDYELTYRAEAAFHFKGGGLVIGFAPSPPARIADQDCEQVGVTTTSSDASGHFYARFCAKPFLSRGVLDTTGDCSGTAVELQGVIVRSSGRVPR